MSPDPADQFAAPRPLDPREIEMARMTVAAPAVFLIINGLLGLVILGLLSVWMVFDPEGMIDSFDRIISQQPPSPEKQEAEQNLAQFRAELQNHRAEIVAKNAAILGGWSLFNLAAIAGGLYMRRLSGYRLSFVGGLASVIPIATGCCISGIPFGIWALIVLSRPEIKAAFAARRNTVPTNPDEQYMK